MHETLILWYNKTYILFLMLWKWIYKGKDFYVKSYCCLGLSRNITYKGVKSINVKVEKVGVIFSLSLYHTCPIPKAFYLIFSFAEPEILALLSLFLFFALVSFFFPFYTATPLSHSLIENHRHLSLKRNWKSNTKVLASKFVGKQIKPHLILSILDNIIVLFISTSLSSILILEAKLVILF